MRRPSMTISNEPTTLSDAIAKANSLYNLGLPLLKDLPPGTTLYEMWQISVTIQQPGPKPDELMVISATESFPLFDGLSGGVTLTVIQGDTKRAPSLSSIPSPQSTDRAHPARGADHRRSPCPPPNQRL
jgi:hypothetical protein